METSEVIRKETDRFIIQTRVQYLEDPEYEVVILITRKVINKKNGTSYTDTIYREPISKMGIPASVEDFFNALDGMD